MKRFLLGVATAALLATTVRAAPNANEENFALEAVSILMLSASNLKTCDVDTSVLMDMVENAYEASGVNPTDYPPGEWTRKIFFHIASDRYYSAVLNHDPASVASFCQTLRTEIIPAVKAKQESKQ